MKSILNLKTSQRQTRKIDCPLDVRFVKASTHSLPASSRKQASHGVFRWLKYYQLFPPRCFLLNSKRERERNTKSSKCPEKSYTAHDHAKGFCSMILSGGRKNHWKRKPFPAIQAFPAITVLESIFIMSMVDWATNLQMRSMGWEYLSIHLSDRCSHVTSCFTDHVGK